MQEHKIAERKETSQLVGEDCTTLKNATHEIGKKTTKLAKNNYTGEQNGLQYLGNNNFSKVESTSRIIIENVMRLSVQRYI